MGGFQHIDEPEPRAQALLAVLAIGAIYFCIENKIRRLKSDPNRFTFTRCD
jgi:hypothetical protein